MATDSIQEEPGTTTQQWPVALFAGTGQAFTLLIVKTNWAIFTLVTLFIIEIPLFFNFAKRHGISIFDDPDDK